MTPNAVAIRLKDEFGRDAVKVPITNRPGAFATVEARDFDRLMAQGVSPTWFATVGSGGHEYVRAGFASATGNQVTISRVLLGLGRGKTARYFTGDRLDLRRSNLEIAKGNAKRNDAALFHEHRQAQVAVSDDQAAAHP